MFLWRKLVSWDRAEEWEARLGAVCGDSLAIIQTPNSRHLRFEVYGLTRNRAARLVRDFGGRAQTFKPASVMRSGRRSPLRIRGRLIISPGGKPSAPTPRQPARKLVIPEGMAFGTGEHATTAACLRMLADVAEEFSDRGWSFLDLGTGTGILAIAAVALGAREVEACDNDPTALRVAQANAQLNGTQQIVFRGVDVTQWKARRPWDVIAANLVSGVLLDVLARVAAALRPGGRLIFSGVLRSQERECTGAARKAGLRVMRITRRGKWITALCAR